MFSATELGDPFVEDIYADLKYTDEVASQFDNDSNMFVSIAAGSDGKTGSDIESSDNAQREDNHSLQQSGNLSFWDLCEAAVKYIFGVSSHPYSPPQPCAVHASMHMFSRNPKVHAPCCKHTCGCPSQNLVKSCHCYIKTDICTLEAFIQRR